MSFKIHAKGCLIIQMRTSELHGQR